MQLIVCTERNNRVSYAVKDDVLIDFSDSDRIKLNGLDRGGEKASNLHILDLNESCVDVITIPDVDLPADWIGNKYRWNGAKLVLNNSTKFKHTDEPDRDMSISHIIKKFK